MYELYDSEGEIVVERSISVANLSGKLTVVSPPEQIGFTSDVAFHVGAEWVARLGKKYPVILPLAKGDELIIPMRVTGGRIQKKFFVDDTTVDGKKYIGGLMLTDDVIIWKLTVKSKNWDDVLRVVSKALIEAEIKRQEAKKGKQLDLLGEVKE